MLVISRKENQTFTIGPDITITVVRIGVDQVKLGIQAPLSYDVRRDDMKQEKPQQEAADAE